MLVYHQDAAVSPRSASMITPIGLKVERRIREFEREGDADGCRGEPRNDDKRIAAIHATHDRIHEQ
jgi:hypothetical protein